MQAYGNPVLAKRGTARSAAAKRSRQISPGEALLAGDAGSRAASFLDLQRSSGNRAVVVLVSLHEGNGNTPTIRLHGETKGHYDGGTSAVLNRKIKRARNCDCPDDNPCYTATGTLKVTYSVDVDIVMPGMPGGLTDCQQRRVRTFLRDVLGPHEQDHARRLRSYNGTTTRPFSVTACGQQTLNDDVNTKLQEMHDDEANQRATDADAKSSAIDPFERDIDLDC